MTWMERFTADLQADHTPGPRAFSLATIAPDGMPNARMVVLRSVTADGLCFTSDARSAKSHELHRNPQAAGCFWMIDQRLQWRLRGRVRVEASPLREETWAALPPAARALFTWPVPGDAFDETATFPQAVDAHPPPPAFQVLTLLPEEVERLDLSPHPHERLLWTARTTGPTRINP